MTMTGVDALRGLLGRTKGELREVGTAAEFRQGVRGLSRPGAKAQTGHCAWLCLCLSLSRTATTTGTEDDDDDDGMVAEARHGPPLVWRAGVLVAPVGVAWLEEVRAAEAHYAAVEAFVQTALAGTAADVRMITADIEDDPAILLQESSSSSSSSSSSCLYVLVGVRAIVSLTRMLQRYPNHLGAAGDKETDVQQFARVGAILLTPDDYYMPVILGPQAADEDRSTAMADAVTTHSIIRRWWDSTRDPQADDAEHGSCVVCFEPAPMDGRSRICPQCRSRTCDACHWRIRSSTSTGSGGDVGFSCPVCRRVLDLQPNPPYS
jgi:hypothetical protein